jgi:hypothetical protein
MIAPPRRPSHDELEALIKEARARQLRRRLLGAAGVAIAAAVGLSAYALTIGNGNHAKVTGGSPSAGPPLCRASQLSATAGLSGATGTMDGGASLTNTSATACALPVAPPRVSIVWRGKQLPARQELMRGAGTKFVHVLAPGAKAWIPVDWANWCGKPSEGTLIRPTLVLHFGASRVAARVNNLMTPPRCGSPGGSTLYVGSAVAA